MVKRPTSLVTALRVLLVVGSTMRISAAGIAAPCWSVMVPVSVPVAACEKAGVMLNPTTSARQAMVRNREVLVRLDVCLVNIFAPNARLWFSKRRPQTGRRRAERKMSATDGGKNFPLVLL